MVDTSESLSIFEERVRAKSGAAVGIYVDIVPVRANRDSGQRVIIG